MLWTGKQLLSCCLPKTVFVDNPYEDMEMDKQVIRNGEILSGTFDKSMFNQLISSCKQLVNSSTLLNFLENIQYCSETFSRKFGGDGITFTAEDWLCESLKD